MKKEKRVSANTSARRKGKSVVANIGYQTYVQILALSAAPDDEPARSAAKAKEAQFIHDLEGVAAAVLSTLGEVVGRRYQQTFASKCVNANSSGF